MAADPSVKEKAWVEVQKKAFTHWVNTFLEKRAMKIQKSLVEDFSDGITIINFLELLRNKKLDKKYNPNPKMRPILIENTHLALQFLKDHGLEPKYITISAEDFVDKKETLLLGFLWMLFRKFRIAKIAGAEDKSEEEGLLIWCRKVTEGYEGVNIKNFKEGFNDGLAWLAMVDKFTESKVIKYNDMLEENSTLENIEQAFQLAEKHLGVPHLIDAKDLMEGHADERSVILYTSLFFHAFMTQEEKLKEKRQLESEFSSKKQKMSEEMQALQAQIEAVKKEKLELEKSLEDLKRLNMEMKEKYEKELHEKDDLMEKLEREKEDLENQIREWKAKFNKLKENADERSQLENRALDVLRKNLVEHLNDINTWKDYLEQDRKSHVPETPVIRDEKEVKDRAFEDQVTFLKGALDSENKKLEVLLKQREIDRTAGGAKKSSKK
eukprot:TRINITY_DN3456_c0_g1_i1.p1 TRINITY_DN3456_c0_g1~~TRINITY_DN3456_c0_g1_i1.p1  ORF type:complete len:439 (+),score=104.80 TRINITY_DN3456_c0_g1_i1:50-1366(+)